MIRHHEVTALRIAYDLADAYPLPVHLYAHGAEPYGESSVSLEFGVTGAGRYQLQLSTRAARELALLLQSFADIADGYAEVPTPAGKCGVCGESRTSGDVPCYHCGDGVPVNR